LAVIFGLDHKIGAGRQWRLMLQNHAATINVKVCCSGSIAQTDEDPISCFETIQSLQIESLIQETPTKIYQYIAVIKK